MTLRENYQLALDQIPSHVRLIAVSKKQTHAAISELYELGQRDFGENYAQELSMKAQYFLEKGYNDIRWHFIGHLQSNKVNLVYHFLSSVHSVSSLKLAKQLSMKSKTVLCPSSKPLEVFIEVNLALEASKSGVPASDVPELARQISLLDGIALQGLMCIPERNSDPRLQFKELKLLEEKCRPYTLGKLSMGMSQDYKIGIEEGASHIRIGTSIFGERPVAH
jgi:pyridoxal phosphate enzyme (YggS family)